MAFDNWFLLSVNTRKLERERRSTGEFVKNNFPKKLRARLVPKGRTFSMGRSLSNPFSSRRYNLKESFHRHLKEEATSTIKAMRTLEKDAEQHDDMGHAAQSSSDGK